MLQTTDRHNYSEHEREFTFAKNVEIKVEKKNINNVKTSQRKERKR